MKAIRFFICLLAVVMLAGCNTVHGFGRDVEKLGDAIQRGSNK